MRQSRKSLGDMGVQNGVDELFLFHTVVELLIVLVAYSLVGPGRLVVSVFTISYFQIRNPPAAGNA